jgi:hypothetical protein
MFNKNNVYKLKEVKNNNLILYTHLGLGDQIICNGLTNYISKSVGRVHLPVFKRNFDNINFLYSENPNVSLFLVDDNNEKDSIKKYAKKNKLQILNVGFSKVKKQSFNTAFYNQLGLDYQISFDCFYTPKDSIKQKLLEEHLFDYYKIDKNKKYNLIHSTSSRATHPLRRKEMANEIFVEKESDLFKNIFLYESLILNANEIHCMNSSFIHIVERVETKAALFYHEIREPSSLKLFKNWNIVNYEQPLT